MVWFSTEYRREALIMVVLVLHWSNIEEVSATSEPLISFDNQTEEIPNVLILDVAVHQFVLDSLNVTLSIPDDATMLQLEVVLNDTSLSEIDISETIARANERIPSNFRFDFYSISRTEETQTITVCDLDTNATMYALRSLTYAYSSEVTAEAFNDTLRHMISLTLTQANITSTIHFTVQYRGANLAPPELSYTGDNVTYVEDDDYVLIFNGTVNITDDDHSSYLLQSATVEIIDYYSQDQLSVMNSTLNYTFTNGVLTITQPASVENYQKAINNIVYNNTDEEPLSGVRTIRVNVTDSPLFKTDLTTTTLNADIFIDVVNIDETPYPVLNNLYLLLNEKTELVKINLTTIDSTDPQDEYIEVSLTLIPASSEIESLKFNGPNISSLEINVTTHSIIVSGVGSKEDYNDIFSNVTYCWNSTNGNLASGNLMLIVTDYSGFTGNVTADIFVKDVEDNNPIFGFASNNVNRTSLLYPMTLATSKVIDYNTTGPVYFLNDIYLRDDGQVKNISVEVAVSATDELSWNQEYNSTNNASTTLYTFTGNISDVLQWEMFLMSFSFCQSAMRPADRNINSNRTINVTVQDCSNTSTVTVIINVLPLPPEVTITVQNTTFVEGHNFILLRRNLSIVVIQDPDAMFVSLTVTLQIGEEGTYKLGATEMLNTVMSPTELQTKNLNENATAHMIIFSNPEGISDEVATQAIQSVIYLNFDNEPLAFDDTGAPLLRKITISTVDTLSRTFQKSFYIRIQPVNDNPPVIRLFTSGNCSSNSTKSLPAMRQKRTTSPQLSQRVKYHSTIQQERQMQAPHVTEIYGDLTDNNCAAYIVIQFSAPVSHPYVDIWPRLSLVLSLSPQYLSAQRPTGAWDGQSTLIITFPDHNCSEWNYNNSHITFKQSNDPCHSLIECLTGICYSNYSGCRITGTFAFNFTTDHDRQATAVDCLYSPTSAPLLADTWLINILVATVVLLLATIFFYCIWKYVSKRLHVTEEDTAQKTVVRGQPSRSRKHNRKKASHKSSTIAQIAAKQQQVNDITSITENMSHDYHHGDCDHILATDKDDVCNNHSPVEEIGFDKDALMGSKYQVARKLMDHDVTIAHNTMTTSDSSHHSNTTDTPRRPAVNDSAFPPDTT